MTAPTRTFAELVRNRAADTPERLMFEDTDGRQMTFGGYADAVRAAADLIDPSVPVAWQLPSSIDAAVLAGALAVRGATQVPLLPVWRGREVAFAVDQVGAGTLVVPPASGSFDHPAMAYDIAAARPGLMVSVGSWPRTAARRWAREEAEGRWVFYTSGTTADPKGARHRDSTIIAAADVMIERYRLGADDRHAVVFPFTHIGGIVWLAVGLMTGMAQLMVGSFQPPVTIPAMRRFGVTVAGAGTAFHQAYLQAQEEHGREPILPRVRMFPGGGASKPAGLHARMKAVFGAGIASGYGLTECPLVTIASPDAGDDKLALTEGRPAPGATVEIVAADETPARPGAEGEIRVAAPQLFDGYVDDSLDAESFDGRGLFRSGDLGYVDADGFLVVTGRIKDVIIRKGENISAKQVEDLLDLHPDVREVAVVGVPDPRSGERAVAVVVPRDPGRPPTLAALGDFLAAQELMRQKHPEQLELIDALPRNPAGKVLKAELRARIAADL